MSESKKNWGWSSTEHGRYACGFDSQDDAILEAFAVDEECESVFVGYAVMAPEILTSIDFSRLAVTIDEWLADYIPAEEEIISIPAEKRDEFNALVREWLVANAKFSGDGVMRGIAELFRSDFQMEVTQ